MLHPEIEAFNEGRLRVSPLHELSYEEVGSPDGRPVLFIHGGPGGGINRYSRRFFDPLHYRAILFDQRGAGKSKPYAEVRENTTSDLIDDIEKLRVHLGIEDWIVLGGSWGSTLALAYAIACPERVKGMVLRGVFLGRSHELDWLYGQKGAAMLFPENYKKFMKPLSKSGQKRPIKAYYEILTGEDEKKIFEATLAWNLWETGISQLIPEPNLDKLQGDPLDGLAIARIESHYFVNEIFLPGEDYLLKEASKLKIPTEIVQGRYDLVCPAATAFEVHKSLKKSKMNIVMDAGHSTTEPGIASAIVQSLNRMKKYS